MLLIRRTWNPYALLLLLSLCLLCLPAFAQSEKGTLSGRVEDAAKAVLQGARVELLPNAGTVTTNERGEFTMSGIAPGTYTLQVLYVGFEPFTQEVTITAGKTTQMDAVIKIQSKNEEVTVYSGRQSGEVEAINRTRAADNILQVLPAEVITSLPNANIADALGRMPSVTLQRNEGEGEYVQIRGTEPRLTNVMVDGITLPSPESGVRQIELDTIASDLVESVEINKTLQANIDADGIGGSVNLRTKTASDTPTLNLYGLGGYTPLQNGRDVMQGGATLGQRFGVQKKLGILIGGTYDYNGRGINDIEPNPNPVSAVPQYSSMDIRDYLYDRTRYGFAGSADYKLGEGSGLYLRGLYSTFRDWGTAWKFTLNDGADPALKQDLRRPNTAIGNLVAGGRHQFSSSWFTWNVSTSRARDLGGASGNGDAKFKWVGGSTNCYNDQTLATSVYRPGWSAGCFTPGTTDVMDENNYSLKEFNLPGQGISAQLNLQASASFAKNYHIGSHFGTFEMGGKIRNAHKFDNSYDMALNMQNDEPVANHPEWASSFSDPNYYDGTYKFGTHLADMNLIRTWALAQGLSVVSPMTVPLGWCSTAPNTCNPNGVSLNSPGGTLNTVNYDLVERVSAGYLMNTIDLSSRLRLVTGVRFENTYVNTLSYGSDPTTGNLVPTYVNQNYFNPLPSASLRITLDKDSGIRLVYGRGLARPDPEMITAAIGDTGNQAPNGNELYTTGNTHLTAEYSDNFDILYERYLKPIGLFQAGYFYKMISDPLIQVEYPGTLSIGGTVTPVMFQQYQNAQSAHVQGIELAYQQHFSFLPGPMHGLGISANYSYTQSQLSGFADPVTGFAYRTDKPALVGQAPNSLNISPTFDTKRFSLRVGMTYNSAMIYQYLWVATPGVPNLGPTGPAGDQYFYPHYQIDIQGSYKLPYGLQVYGYGLNLNNEVFGFYAGSQQYVNQREYYKPTFAGGLRYTFGQE